MSAEPQGYITELLKRISIGDKAAENQLFELVYNELHAEAHRLMEKERPNHTWQTTELVNAAYIRLFKGNQLHREETSRGFFFTAMRNAMQKVLIDYARKQLSKKREGDWNRTTLDDVQGANGSNMDVLELEEALQELKKRSERQYDVVTHRYYTGLKSKEIAELLQVSVSTVEKDWDIAQAWLRSKLKG